MAKENTRPSRVLGGQRTLLSRTMHDIRYDAVHDEILVTNPFAQALLVFRGGASGEEAPLRIIQGSRTQLVGFGTGGLDRLDVDPVHNEIFVPNGDSVLVFAREATGNVAPLRVIRGSETQLQGTTVLAIDPVHNLLVVVDSGRRGGRGGAILIYNRTDNGNVKPRAVIRGPGDMGFRTSSQIQVYPPKGWIIVATQRREQTSNTRDVEPGGVGLGVWHINDNGVVPPRWHITGEKSMLKRPRGVALSPQHKEVYVADMRQNAILTYYFPEIF